MIDVDVVGESIQPRKERASLPAVAPDGFPGLEEDLFGQVFCLGVATSPEVQIPVHPVDETVVQLAKRRGIVGSDRAIDERDDCGFVAPLVGLGRLGSWYRQRLSVPFCYARCDGALDVHGMGS